MAVQPEPITERLLTSAKPDHPPNPRDLASFSFSEAIVYLAFFILNIVLNMRYWSAFLMMNDEAVTVVGAQRWLKGGWPYWAWETHHAPGCYAVSTLFMAVFGSGQAGTRALMLLVSSLQGLVVLYLSRPLGGAQRYLPWALWTLLGLMDFPILGYHWMSALSFSVLVVCCQRWLASGEGQVTRRAFAAGTMVAVSGFVLQSEGLAGVTLVALCWLLWRPKGLGSVIAACAGTTVLLWGPFVPVGRVVLKDSFLEMRTFLVFNHHAYTWSDLTWLFRNARSAAPGSLDWAHGWLEAFVYSFKHGSYYILLSLALVKYWRRRDQPLTVLALGVTVLVMANMNRQTLEYMSYFCPLWFILAVGVLGRRAGLTVVLLVALFWATDLATWQRDFRYPVSTPAGLYWTEHQVEADIYAKIGQWVTRKVGLNRPILCFPFTCDIYSLYGVPNPIREPILVPLSVPESTFQTARRLIDEQGTEWVIYVPLSSGDCNADPVVFNRTQAAMVDLLTQGFGLVESFHGTKLFRRSAEKP